MYGLIGKLISVENKRDQLINILIAGSADMPGNISYIVSKDSEDPNGIWISEVWETRQQHLESLNLESVKQAMAQGKPLIADFASRFETEPVGGRGT